MNRTYITLLIKPCDRCKDDIVELYGKCGTFYEGDSGLDLFCLEDQVIPAKSYSNKISFGVCVEAFYLRRFYPSSTRNPKYQKAGEYKEPSGINLYARSSTGSKTPLRLSNSVGVLDENYRGEIFAFVDNVSDKDFLIKKGERYFQLAAPTLAPMSSALVDKLSETSRGERGFGSTGK